MSQIADATAPLADDAPAPTRARSVSAEQLGKWHNRLIALTIFAASSLVIGLAAWLKPDAAGMGTHQALGLPPCQFEQVTGMPCATCGCTTSFSHAANGSMLDAFVTQPFGAVLALLTAMAVLISGYAMVVNMPISPLIQAMSKGKVIVAFLVLMLVAWGYNIVQHLA